MPSPGVPSCSQALTPAHASASAATTAVTTALPGRYRTPPLDAGVAVASRGFRSTRSFGRVTPAVVPTPPTPATIPTTPDGPDTRAILRTAGPGCHGQKSRASRATRDP